MFRNHGDENFLTIKYTSDRATGGSVFYLPSFFRQHTYTSSVIFNTLIFSFQLLVGHEVNLLHKIG